MLIVGMGFVPNAKAEQAAINHAREAVKVAAERYGITLDWSEDSIREADRLLARIHHVVSARVPLPEDTEGATVFGNAYGCYVGEVFRKYHGGGWGIARYFPEDVPVLQVGTGGAIISPCTQARARITNGDGENLWGYYEALRSAVTRSRPAAPSAAKMAPVRESYTLAPDQYLFDTGTTSDGRQ